jgi:2-polyprenyl-3-methyl-5-hydroxy-6-metoxy-1,4-benzoquinol methylase
MAVPSRDVPATSEPELARLAELGWSGGGLPVTPDGVRVASRPTQLNYPEQGLTALGLDGGRGYWFDHRAQSVIDALRLATTARTIWDVGAGAGSMSVRLADAGYEVVSVEPHATGAAAIAQHGRGAVFCGTLESLALPMHSIRVIGMFDVIEHLDDPDALVHEVRRVLEPSGVLVVTVPALPILWSNSDDVAGHQRRYTRASLDSFMQASGLTRVRSSYLFASLVPAAFALRTVPYRLGRRKRADEVMAATARRLKPNTRVDAIAARILRGERAVSRRVPIPVGLSVLGVYRAPAR